MLRLHSQVHRMTDKLEKRSPISYPFFTNQCDKKI